MFKLTEFPEFYYLELKKKKVAKILPFKFWL